MLARQALLVVLTSKPLDINEFLKTIKAFERSWLTAANLPPHD